MASYLNDVARNDTHLVVYKFNKPIAVIIPPEKDLVEDDITKYFGFLGKGGETGDELVKRIRRSPQEKAHIRKLRNRSKV